MIRTEVIGVDRVVVRFEALGDAARARLRLAVGQEAFALVRYIQDEELAGQMVQQRTRRLRDSIHFEVIETAQSVVATVGSDVPYARFVHDGTAPHDIVAKNAKALAFMVGGEKIFRRRVHHPGTKGRPFLTAGLAAREAAIRARLDEAVRGTAGGAP